MNNFNYVIEILNIEKYSLIRRIKEIDRFEEYETPYFQEAQKRISGINTSILEIDEAISLLRNGNKEENSRLKKILQRHGDIELNESIKEKNKRG